jgi:hypothetical protein
MHAILLGHAAVATTVAAVGTLAVESQDDAVPTMHEGLVATILAAEAEGAAPDVSELRASIEPMAPDPETFDAAALVKAVGLEEARAEREARAREAEARCRSNRSGFGPVKPWVAQAGGFLRCEFDIATVGASPAVVRHRRRACAVEGVREVRADHTSGRVEVRVGPELADSGQLVARIETAGYEVVEGAAR